MFDEYYLETLSETNELTNPSVSYWPIPAVQRGSISGRYREYNHWKLFSPWQRITVATNPGGLLALELAGSGWVINLPS